MLGRVCVRVCVCVWGGTFKSLEGKRCLEKEAVVPRRADSLFWKEKASLMVVFI